MCKKTQKENIKWDECKSSATSIGPPEGSESLRIRPAPHAGWVREGGGPPALVGTRKIGLATNGFFLKVRYGLIIFN